MRMLRIGCILWLIRQLSGSHSHPSSPPLPRAPIAWKTSPSERAAGERRKAHLSPARFWSPRHAGFRWTVPKHHECWVFILKHISSLSSPNHTWPYPVNRSSGGGVYTPLSLSASESPEPLHFNWKNSVSGSNRFHKIAKSVSQSPAQPYLCSRRDQRFPQHPQRKLDFLKGKL